MSDCYKILAEQFYSRSRKYLQADELRADGQWVNLQHCQAWVIICIFEFKSLHIQRGWQSAGRAVRMAQMLGLHRIHESESGDFGPSITQTLPPPIDWTEREERCRTFWLAFCCERYASVGTGWPISIDERDVRPTSHPSIQLFC